MNKRNNLQKTTLLVYKILIIHKVYSVCCLVLISCKLVNIIQIAFCKEISYFIDSFFFFAHIKQRKKCKYSQKKKFKQVIGVN